MYRGQRLPLDMTLERLRGSYTRRIQDGALAIEGMLSLARRGPLLKQDLVRAHYLVHGFAGSGATLGFEDITRSARMLELMIDGMAAPMALGEPLGQRDAEILERELLVFRDLLLRESMDEEGRQAPCLDGDPSASSEAQVLRILVVDDDYFLTEVVRAALEMSGYEAVVCRNGYEALSMLSEGRHAMVVLDITMPEMSGHEILKRLKQSAEYARMPVVMLTGSTNKDDRENALLSGAAAYITKPFDIEGFLETISDVLKQSENSALPAH